MLTTLFLILHIVGTALGVGGATVSDVQFFKTIKDAHIDHHEYDLLKAVSNVIWIGLFLAIISGLGILWSNNFMIGGAPWYESSKFLLKNTVVAVILINGIFMHFQVFPLFHIHKNKKLMTKEFIKKAPRVFSSGAISIISWYTALILGVLRGLPYSYWQILLVYIIILVTGVAVARYMGHEFCRRCQD